MKARSHPLRIVFFGNFGSTNLGNECTLQAIVDAAKRQVPHAELSVVCSDPIAARREHGLPATSIAAPYVRKRQLSERRRLSSVVRALRILLVRVPVELVDLMRLFRLLRRVDLLAIPGTGVISDFANRPFQHPYELFKWTLMARLCRSRVRFVSAGVGPINARLSRVLLKAALGLADYRSYRDERSRQSLKAFGFDSDGDSTCPDLAFSLPKDMFCAPRPKFLAPCVVAVGVMDYRLGRAQERNRDYLDYVSKTADLVQWLLAGGNHVRIVIGDLAHDRKPRDDLLAALARRGICADGERLLSPEISSVDELIAQLAESDVVISPRFHNLVFALMLHRPAISLSYDPKNDALLEAAGLGAFTHPLERFDVSGLARQFSDLLASLPSIEPKISAFLSSNRLLLEKEFETVFAGLARCRGAP